MLDLSLVLGAPRRNDESRTRTVVRNERPGVLALDERILEDAAATLREALKYVPVKHLHGCTNCGMAPMRRDIALRKLEALAQGAALARRRYA